MFTCINPLHDDTNASCKLLPDANYEQYYCYGCHITGDIFTANHILNSKPLEGLEFIEENIYQLAEKYGVHFEPIDWSEEQLEAFTQGSFIRTVTNLINRTTDDGTNHNWDPTPGEDRSWTAQTQRELGITCVSDLNLLVSEIQVSTKMIKQEIRDRGVSKEIFGPDKLTITLHDERGIPKGFTARWLGWKPGAKGPKYKNSSNSTTFVKSNILHGIHIARKQKHRRLDLFEGNADFITASQAGHKVCAGIGGTALTDEQVNLIIRLGFTAINLVFDADSAGKAAADKYMDKLSGHEGLVVTITALPKGSDDPDQFIKDNGLAALFGLKCTGAFEYFLEKETLDTSSSRDTMKFINKMIKLITNTDNRVARGQQLKSLSEFTSVPIEDLRDELDRLTRLDTEIVKNTLQRELSRATGIDELISIIDRSKDAIESTSGSKEERNKLSIMESVDAFDNLCTILDNKRVGLQGWKTGHDILDLKLSGIPKPVGTDSEGNSLKIPGAIMGIAGAPQHGKSTVLSNIALGVAFNNDDVTILYWSLDDSRERTFERLIAMRSGVDWKKVTRRVIPNEFDLELINKAKRELRELMADGTLILKDHKTGSTIPMLKRWIGISHEQIGKPIMVVIDSFHKISESSSESGKTDFSITKAHSQEIKKLAQTHNVTVLASLEMNKGQGHGQEPQLSHITETRKIEFDFDIIALVYNQYYELDGNTENVTVDADGKITPLIKFNIKKSKEGGAGPIWLGLNTENLQVEFFTVEEMKSMTNKAEVQDTDMGSGLRLSPPDKGTLKNPWE